MKDILILGGTRFVGKKLVNLLLQQGYNVTIGTRGRTDDGFGDQVNRVQLDRGSLESLQTTVGAKKWDIVYDNLCYTPSDARHACKVFANNVNQYIVISTLSVYDFKEEAVTEADFNPYELSIPEEVYTRSELTYQAGKRYAEAVLFQQASFPVSAVRLPIILGLDDYTKRLHFHIEHIRNGTPIGLPNPEANISFIDSDEAAAFLAWLGEQSSPSLAGPINACSAGHIKLRDLFARIEQEVGRAAITRSSTDQEHMSPFGIAHSWYMNTAKAEQAGYAFKPLDQWLTPLIRDLNREMANAE
ncbi:NAD-dependent epimerase/dehydratase family protein [Paenibacillus sp. 481]|uniref:NAD-dependent epimerase/dehydratase family protein n=1 Tax=Paenibacillus sp. 481 TaxID=2835869 RepID=UPI001E4285B7|nr:NAD-dependent epimerase/dehydratase family protein [Paenibacillus sp. 481]UHA74844.1 NAD-dependent epimerase/dehydratase family protein [Paenibacillus sp. 481]